MNADEDAGSESDSGDEIHYAILLRSRPAVALLTASPGIGFRADGQTFTNREDLSNTGFYDCLHSDDGSVVGVSYLPFDDLAFLGPDKARFISAIRQLDYIDVVNDRIINIYLIDKLGARRAESGGEQEFGECRVFAGDGGEFALSFQTCCITRSDLDVFWRSGTTPTHIEILGK